MSLELVTAPSVEIMTTATAKAHLRVDSLDDDTLITDLIVAARLWIESELGRQLITASWRLYLDIWPEDGVIRLPKPPLQSVTSISYLDADGVEQVLSSSIYTVDKYSIPARIQPAYGEDWPAAREAVNSIKVLFSSGYGSTAASVPMPILKAAKLLIAHLYEHREDVLVTPPGLELSVLPDGMEMLLHRYVAITDRVSI